MRLSTFVATMPQRVDFLIADELFTPIDELEGVARSARSVPLTSQVRVEKERVFDLLDHMRATFPVAVREARAE
jgi:hypothetical protein